MVRYKQLVFKCNSPFSGFLWGTPPPPPAHSSDRKNNFLPDLNPPVNLVYFLVHARFTPKSIYELYIARRLSVMDPTIDCAGIQYIESRIVHVVVY